MKNKRLVLTAAAICICMAVASIWVFGESLGSFFRIGQARQSADAAADEEVLAYYKKTPITRAMVAYQQKVDAERDEALRYNESEAEIVDRLLAGLVMLDEAEAQGIAATDAEIEAFMTAQKDNYEKFPEASAMIDDYCKGAGMTLDEYWADLEEQAYGTISRQKLQDKVTQAYCAEAGYTGDTHTAEYAELAKKAMDSYRKKLLETYASDISYR
jgi:FKBP-type peptidyl-prolyl cis-trans isomerase (trigger factor)